MSNTDSGTPSKPNQLPANIQKALAELLESNGGLRTFRGQQNYKLSHTLDRVVVEDLNKAVIFGQLGEPIRRKLQLKVLHWLSSPSSSSSGSSSTSTSSSEDSNPRIGTRSNPPSQILFRPDKRPKESTRLEERPQESTSIEDVSEIFKDLNICAPGTMEGFTAGSKICNWFDHPGWCLTRVVSLIYSLCFVFVSDPIELDYSRSEQACGFQVIEAPELKGAHIEQVLQGIYHFEKGGCTI
jgi:hypothetical protein